MNTILACSDSETLLPSVRTLASDYSDTGFVWLDGISIQSTSPEHFLAIGRACFQAAEALTALIAARAAAPVEAVTA